MNDLLILLCVMAAALWAGLSIAAGLVLAWTQSNLPIHILEVLRFLGWHSRTADFWTGDMSCWTRRDFQAWTALKLHPWLADLVNCPVCMSYHISFWVASGLTAALACWHPARLLLLLIPLGTLIWPVHINRLLK